METLQTLLKHENLLDVVDGKWGPKSQAALEVALKTKDLYLDFQAFRQVFKLKALMQGTVDGINAIFEAIKKHNITNPAEVAYILATAYHETAHTMQPIKEYGSYSYLARYDTGRLAKILGNTPEADGDGQRYAGRGFVQITGKTNYKRYSDILGVDLLENPDLALEATTAAEILVHGSIHGVFTGKKLANYITYGSTSEYINARRVINGTDKARTIAVLAKNFEKCLTLKE